MQSPAERAKEAASPTPPAISTLSLAFASFIILNKPPELSATEFIYYLRGCVQKDPSSRTGHLRHLSNESYWRNICEDKDLKILELDQKLIEANMEIQRLTELLKRKRDDDDSIAKAPKSKKAKTSHPEPVDALVDRLIEWQPLKRRKKTHSKPSSGTKVLTFLEVHHHVGRISNIPIRITRLCKALSVKIHSLVQAPRDDAPASQTSNDTRLTRQADSVRRRRDSEWVANVTKGIDELFRCLVMDIARLLDFTERYPPTNSTRTTVVSAITDLIVSILASFHLASQEYANAESTVPANRLPRARDIRAGTTNIIQAFLTTLAACANTCYRSNNLYANIAENILFTITEAAGKCLCLPTPMHTVNNIERAARNDTAGFVLELLKTAVPLYRQQIAKYTSEEHISTVLKLTKHRFHDAVMKGLFGEKAKIPSWMELQVPAKDGSKTWGGIEMQEQFVFVDERGFAEKVWKLLELEEFALVW
ncbi:hypothetical protein TWF696_006332 [Orbilia brochopaga]|uniref:Uncharacterized protein n=1 Tax=Orbilia brochopaga TaxID=3140254 RepID=A0AAV9UVY1_9PEZI